MSPRFYRRRFLNLRGHHGGAYVLASIDVEEDGDSLPVIFASLTVSDCNRAATLDFSVENAAAARNALHKAKALRAVVDDFVVALERTVTDAVDAVPPSR